MDFSPLADHRAFVAANIAHLGNPHVTEQIVTVARDTFNSAHHAFTKRRITQHEFETHEAVYVTYWNKVRTALDELHEAWVAAGQPKDGEAFIENLLNPPPPPPEPEPTPADAESHEQPA